MSLCFKMEMMITAMESTIPMETNVSTMTRNTMVAASPTSLHV